MLSSHSPVSVIFTDKITMLLLKGKSNTQNQNPISKRRIIYTNEK